MDRETKLRKLQQLELQIALEIQRICKKNGLRCFLIYGSLLGAVRHGGFIPWDDDMDMGMLREDYDKFAEACQTDLGPEFLWQSWDNDPSYPFPAGKVRLKGTHAKEIFSPEGLEDGIYVDVFPFDAVPDGVWTRKVTGWQYRVWKRLLWVKKGYGRCIRQESAVQRLRYNLAAAVAFFLPYGWLKRRMKAAMGKCRGQRTRQVAAPGDWAYSRQFVTRAWAEDLVSVPFDGEELPAFREADSVLRKIYGDYMQLPPEDQRGGHEFERIDFGPYEAGVERK